MRDKIHELPPARWGCPALQGPVLGRAAQFSPRQRARVIRAIRVQKKSLVYRQSNAIRVQNKYSCDSWDSCSKKIFAVFCQKIREIREIRVQKNVRAISVQKSRVKNPCDPWDPCAIKYSFNYLPSVSGPTANLVFRRISLFKISFKHRNSSLLNQHCGEAATIQHSTINIQHSEFPPLSISRVSSLASVIAILATTATKAITTTATMAITIFHHMIISI